MTADGIDISDEAVAPEDGDVSVCGFCGDIAMYSEPDGSDGIIGLRQPTDGELDILREKTPEVFRAAKAAVAARITVKLESLFNG